MAIINGTPFNDILTGTAGDDTLDGGAGDDTMNGGAGNDVYYVDSAGDSVAETVTVPLTVTRVTGSAIGDYGFSAVSSDGRWVAFQDLFNGIYVQDLQTGTLTRIDVGGHGTPADSTAWYPAMSADGRYVFFWSDAGNLVPGDTLGVPDVFVKDTQTGTLGLVAPGQDVSSSADGRIVAFTTPVPNLVSGDTNWDDDIFVKDLQTGGIVRVTLDIHSSGIHGFVGLSPRVRIVVASGERSFIRIGGSEVTRDVEIFEGQEGARIVVDVAAGEPGGA